jgi:uncharacterized protein
MVFRFPTLVLAFLALATSARAALDLPAVPPDENFLQDYAEMIPREAQKVIGELQEKSFEDHDTPIVVVTISSMKKYGGDRIERFAREWFDHWEIGKRGGDGQLLNQGILLLVSRDDRQARIELGGDWGLRWDRHCARIMERRIIPRFKEGRFAEGIVAGVEALKEMAEEGPDSEPPVGLSKFFPTSLEEKPLSTSPLPTWGMGLILMAGVGLIVASFFFPQQRKRLLLVGAGLIVVAVIFWVVLALFAIYFHFRSGGRTGGGLGSGGFSGGGFGGGFSGGGGASGSW